MNRYQKQHYCESQWIGAVIKKPSLWKEKTVDLRHFYTHSLANVFKTMEKRILNGILIDFHTWNTLTESEMESIGGMDTITECYKNCVTTNEDSFLKIENDMKTFFMGEEIRNTIHELNDEQDNLETIQSVAQHIHEVANDVSERKKDFKELLLETHEGVMNKSEGLSGIDMGFSNLNEIDIFQETSLIVLSARPSVGKTATSVNLFLKAAKNGAYSLFVPSETGDKSIIYRSWAVHGNLHINKVKNPNHTMDNTEKIRFKEACKEFYNLPCDILDTKDIREMRRYIRKKKKEIGNQKMIVFIDHLQTGLTDGNNYGNNQNLEYESYTNQIKQIAKENNICIVLLSQLNRSIDTRESKIPTNSDLRGSGSIEAIADTIVFIHRDEVYKAANERDPNNDILQLHITKNRDGALAVLDFKFIPQSNRITVLKTPY